MQNSPKTRQEPPKATKQCPLRGMFESADPWVVPKTKVQLVMMHKVMQDKIKGQLKKKKSTRRRSG